MLHPQADVWVPLRVWRAWRLGALGGAPGKAPPSEARPVRDESCEHHIHSIDDLSPIAVVPICMRCGHVDWKHRLTWCSRVTCPDYPTSIAEQARAEDGARRTAAGRRRKSD